MTTARRCVRTAAAGLFAAFLAGAAQAHTLVVPYTLPVPFWLYLYACAATLVLSFVAVGYFSGLSPATSGYRTRELLPPVGTAQAVWTWVVRAMRAGALVCLLLTLAGGLVGTGDPRANINMTLFWVGFLLGFTYATALLGDLYALVNPWRTLIDLIEALCKAQRCPRKVFLKTHSHISIGAAIGTKDVELTNQILEFVKAGK